MNEEFKDLVQLKSLTIAKSYQMLVDKYPYRLLSMHEFFKGEPALRSQRTTEAPLLTDVKYLFHIIRQSLYVHRARIFLNGLSLFL